MNEPTKKVMSTQYMVRVAIFSAIAFVVMYLEFPLGTLFPPYLQIDFSEAVVFIGGVVLGPAAVILMEVLKNLLHLIFRAGTGGVG
jgi:riboflavin transporter FmnP